MRFVTLQEEHRLRVSENRMLRGIFDYRGSNRRIEKITQ
jgi:hypothetical protein